jgi:hypothetical protein
MTFIWLSKQKVTKRMYIVMAMWHVLIKVEIELLNII